MLIARMAHVPLIPSRSASGSARPIRRRGVLAAILDYFKRGMDEFLRSRGISPNLAYRNRKRNFGFPVVATRCRYRAPVRFDDLLTLRTRVARVEGNGVTFGFSLFRTEAGRTSSPRKEVTCRAIDATWKTIPLPPE